MTADLLLALIGITVPEAGDITVERIEPNPVIRFTVARRRYRATWLNSVSKIFVEESLRSALTMDHRMSKRLNQALAGV